MTRAVHVLHVIGSLNLGGAEKCALDLCAAIPATEIHQTFVCLSGDDGVLACEFRAAGAEVIALPLTRSPRAALALRRTIRSCRPDIVMSHLSLASGPVLALAWSAGVRRRVARMHSTGDEHGAHWTRRAYRWCAAGLLGLSANSVIGVSSAATGFAAAHGPLRGRIARRSRVVPNGVDLDTFHPGCGPGTTSSTPVALYVGRAAPEKNRAVLVPILAELRAARPWSLVVVGPGGTEDLATPYAPGLSTLGERSDVDVLLRSADVLLLTSVREGQPGVVLEALASDVPVVASDLPTIRELASQLDGITLVAPAAPPAAWAEAVEKAVARRGESHLRAGVVGSRYDLRVSVETWFAEWSS